jgi:hypothetical protein
MTTDTTTPTTVLPDGVEWRRVTLPPDCPPPPGFFAGTALAEYADKLTGLVHAAADAIDAHTRLISPASVENARDADAHALGQAIADGKPDPGETHAGQLAEDVTTAYRRATGTVQAVLIARDEFAQAIGGKVGTAFRAELDERAAKARADLVAALDALQAAATEYEGLAQRRRWLAAVDDWLHRRGEHVRARWPQGVTGGPRMIPLHGRELPMTELTGCIANAYGD